MFCWLLFIILFNLNFKYLYLSISLLFPGAVLSGVAVVQVICELMGSAALNTFYSFTEEAGHPSDIYLLITAVEIVCLIIMV